MLNGIGTPQQHHSPSTHKTHLAKTLKCQNLSVYRGITMIIIKYVIQTHTFESCICSGLIKYWKWCRHSGVFCFFALSLVTRDCGREINLQSHKHYTLHFTAASHIAAIQHLGNYCGGLSENRSACCSFKKMKRKWAETPVSPPRVRCAAHFKVKGSRECGTNEASGTPIQTSTSR